MECFSGSKFLKIKMNRSNIFILLCMFFVIHNAQSQISIADARELDEGTEVTAGDPIAVVESVKAASDIYAPVSGTVIERNSSLEDTPEQVNEDAYENGWFFKIKLADALELNDLMDSDSYADQCAED